MKIIRGDEGETKVIKSVSGFGELVSLLPPQRDGGIKLALVSFKDGARTHWHEHPGEQVLYILEGEGRVGTETDEWAVMPGDLVYTAPDERHWHGATPGKSMTHISITNIGPPHWYEAVE